MYALSLFTIVREGKHTYTSSLSIHLSIARVFVHIPHDLSRDEDAEGEEEESIFGREMTSDA